MEALVYCELELFVKLEFPLLGLHQGSLFSVISFQGISNYSLK